MIKRCFMEFEVDGKTHGKLYFELSYDICPITCENFRCLCTGEKGFGYKNSKIHSVIPGEIIVGGDITKGDGSGGKSIYGGTFEDENFRIKHTQPGMVGMVSKEPNSNNSQFFITLNSGTQLHGKCVVFAKVVEGLEVARFLEVFGSLDGKTKKPIKIKSCGENY